MLSVPRKSVSSGSQHFDMLPREDVFLPRNITTKRDDSRRTALTAYIRAPLAKKPKPSSPPKKPKPSAPVKKAKTSSPAKKVKPSSPVKKVKPSSPAKGPKTTTKRHAPTVATTVGPPPPNPGEIYRGPPTEDLTGGWPPGWIRTEVQRKSGDHRDRYWYSPGGKKFRSMREVERFFKALKKVKGDENAAWTIFRGK
jgi:Methyl-CpG binding domain